MSRKTNRDKDPKRRAIPFQPKMNPIRKELLERIGIAMAAHKQREAVGDMVHLNHAFDFNREFIERSRGKGGKRKPHGSTFVRSVALAR